MAKKNLNGPNGLKIILDSNEVFPDDPGQGTPVIVEKRVNGRAYGSTFSVALGEGYLLGNGEDYSLKADEIKWLQSQEETCDKFVDDIYKKLKA